jgi:hypothetical protein
MAPSAKCLPSASLFTKFISAAVGRRISRDSHPTGYVEGFPNCHDPGFVGRQIADSVSAGSDSDSDLDLFLRTACCLVGSS